MFSEKATKEIQQNGYVVFPSYYNVDQQTILFSDSLARDRSYLPGKSYKTNNLNSLPTMLRDLIFTQDIENVFRNISKTPEIKCQDVFITHELEETEQKERNNWLHFDRLRSLKAMVYLSEVSDSCGPFSVVPGSHLKGRSLRQNFANQSDYEEKLNRIELDYEHMYEEPTKILGSIGTLILFDTDIFHKGGDVKQGSFRKIIRSHWYVDYSWRITS